MTNRSNIGFLTPKPIQPELPLFVYLPGMDCTGELLTVQAEKLAKVFDLRCLYISPTDLSSWEKLTEATIKLIQKELIRNPQRTVYLCGESFGGCLAIKTILAAPELIHKLILVNPASSFYQRSWLGLGGILTNLIPDLIHRYSALGFLPFLAELSRMAQSERLALLKAMRSIPRSVLGWRLSLLQNFGSHEQQLTRLTQPTLILAGGSDRLLPSLEEAQRLVNLIPKADMVVLPYSGHACLLETQTDLYTILEKNCFLDHLDQSHKQLTSKLLHKT